MWFNNILVHFIFREFNWVSMSKMPTPPLYMESRARCLRGCIFFAFQRNTYILSISLLIYFGIVYVWPMYHSFGKKTWLIIIFLPLKESLTLLDVWNSLLYLLLFFPRIIKIRLIKTSSKYFHGKLRSLQLSWLINSIFVCCTSLGLAFAKLIFKLACIYK